MTWMPYEISFLPTARARKRQTVIRFGLDMESCLTAFKHDPDVQRDWPEMSGFIIREAGDPAEARVNGVLRGGRVLGRHFYYHADQGTGALVSLLSECSELTVY